MTTNQNIELRIHIRLSYTPQEYLAPFWRSPLLLQTDVWTDGFLVTVSRRYSILSPENHLGLHWKFGRLEKVLRVKINSRITQLTVDFDDLERFIGGQILKTCVRQIR